MRHTCLLAPSSGHPRHGTSAIQSRPSAPHAAFTLQLLQLSSRCLHASDQGPGGVRAPYTPARVLLSSRVRALITFPTELKICKGGTSIQLSWANLGLLVFLCVTSFAACCRSPACLSHLDMGPVNFNSEQLTRTNGPRPRWSKSAVHPLSAPEFSRFGTDPRRLL